MMRVFVNFSLRFVWPELTLSVQLDKLNSGCLGLGVYQMVGVYSWDWGGKTCSCPVL